MNENIMNSTEIVREPRPTIGAASGLFLLTLLLVAVAGSAIQMVSIPWGLIATEIFLIFLPAYLYLRVRKLPVAETVRWRWPGTKAIILTILIGLCLNQFVNWLVTALTTALHYSLEVYSAMVPTSLPDAIVMFVGMAIMAPLCEEFLFRGVIQRGYETRGVGWAIGMVAVMFSFYHMSFLRFLGILPFALVICWMYWRSDSLVTSIVLHFAYNLFAPVSMLLALIWPDFPLDWAGTLPVALVGLALGLGLLVIFRRITPKPAASQWPRAAFGWRQAWPLIPAGLIILLLASAEAFVAFNPDLLVTQPLELAAPEWSQPAAWTYEIRNRSQEVIGQATCTRTLVEATYQLDCQFDHQKAYELQQGSSFYKDGIHHETLSARWNAAGLTLLDWQSNLQGNGSQTLASAVGEGNDLSLQVMSNQTPEAPLALTPAMLLPGEWPWRLMALPFADGLAYKVTVAYPSKWSQEQQRSLPLAEGLALRVAGKETVETPVGSVEAWKVTLGSETAWYGVDAPHSLVKYDNGMNIYILTK